jgi:hypothetical protein
VTLPNFLIVGAAKSGTTSLFHYLGQHPEVYVPPCKEPCYFSGGQPNIVNSDDEYEMLFSGATTEKAIGEASATYLYDQEAPRRISNLLGDVKIIIILRNPVTRAYSAWGHNYYQVGYETLSFEDALLEEDARMASQRFREKCPFYYGEYYYFHRGLYYKQVKRYFDTFGRGRVQVHIFEEFVKDPAATCRVAFTFLGVDPDFEPIFKTYNASPAFRIGFVHRFLVTPPLILDKVYHSLPARLRFVAYRVGKSVYWLNQKYRPRPPLDREIKTQLLEKYREDITKLEELLGRDLFIWYSDAIQSTDKQR